jgi:hypothetical protein
MKTKTPPGKPGGVFLFLEMFDTRQEQRNQAHDVSPTGGYENEDASRETGQQAIWNFLPKGLNSPYIQAKPHFVDASKCPVYNASSLRRRWYS